jgi:hypothetical protein
MFRGRKTAGVRRTLLILVSLLLATSAPRASAQPPREDRLRQTPRILAPDEYAVAYVRATLPALVFAYENRGGQYIQSHIYIVEIEAEAGRQRQRIREIRVDRGDEVPKGWTLATRALPLRMGIVTASFPYKRQVEEFRQKLRLTTHAEVLAATLPGTALPAFRFRGLTVQRATFDLAAWENRNVGIDEWKPAEKDWEPLPHAEAYKALRDNAAGLLEPDPELLMPVKQISKDLVHDLPKQFFGFSYPNTLKPLTKFRAALEMLPENRDALPEHCLIRFLDVGGPNGDNPPPPEPGKVHRYRFKVRMTNPNYSPKPNERKDTTPERARARELESEWYVVPQDLVVPSDTFVYAVDEGKRGLVPPPDVAVFQFHRWVEDYCPNPSVPTDKPVGEWVVAPRVFIKRGEFVRLNFGKKLDLKSDLVLKNLDAHNFEVESGYVPFGDGSVLVDFEGGKLTHRRPRNVKITDEASTEVLVMTPDGKVYARNYGDDLADRERMFRRIRYEEKVKALKKGGGR